MSEARQKAQQMEREAELDEQSEREQEKKQRKQLQSAKATPAGQENKSVEDALIGLAKIQKGDTSIKTSQARNAEKIQKQQIEQAEKKIEDIRDNPSKYVIENPETGETKAITGNDITAYQSEINAAKVNLSKIRSNIQIGEKAKQGYNQYIRDLREADLQPNYSQEYIYKSSPTAEIKKQKQVEAVLSSGKISGVTTGPVMGPPGPARGPKPGSRGDLLKTSIDAGIAREEQFFETAVKPLTDIKKQAYNQAIEAKKQGRDFEAGFTYSLSTLYSAGNAFITGYTAPVRPGLIQKTGKSLENAVKNPLETGAYLYSEVKSDPAGAAVALPAGYLGGVAFGKTAEFSVNKIAPIVKTKQVYKFPSELGQTSKSANINYVEPARYPKGTRLYTDYSGELRAYMPASARWNQLVQGGDQFINDAVYTSLIDARPTGTTVPKAYPTRPNYVSPGISPIKVEVVMRTPRIGDISRGTGLYGSGASVGLTTRQIEAQEKLLKPKPLKKLVEPQKPSITESPKQIDLTTSKAISIESNITETTQVQKQKARMVPLNLDIPDFVKPKPQNPRFLDLPDPSIIKTPKPRVSTPLFDRKKRSRKQVKNPLGFEDREYPLVDLFGGSKKKKKRKFLI